MSQTLYEEAIAEARRLTEMAEQNAKNKIIDAVTPQIKRLIEQELMGDTEEMEDESDADETEDDGETIDLDKMLSGISSSSDDDSEDQEMSSPETSDAMSKVSAPSLELPSGAKGPSSLKISDGEVELKMGNVKIEIEQEEEEELEESASRSLANILSNSPAARRRLRERLVVLEKKILTLKRALLEARTSGTASQKRRLANIFEALAREAVTLRKQAILTERSTGGRTLESNLVNSIIKEMKHMSRRSNKNVFDFLFEAEEDKSSAEETESEETESEETESEETEDAGGAGDVDMSAAGDALKALGDALGLSVTVGDEGEEEGGEDEGGEDDGGDDELGDMELDLGEVDMSTEESTSYEEGDTYESDSDMSTEEAYMREADDADDDATEESKTYEIDESALRRELRRLRRVNEGEAVSAAKSYGGGVAGDEMFVDVDEETLLNALADELGDAPHPKMGGAGISETRRSRSAVTEARALRRQVADYRNVASQLKSQLVEMNLFNAKLLYANKLMQNRDLSAKQQRAIVEALDNAKTLREAKLLYKSLTASLNKAANKGSLSEGRVLRTLGSSSKSARSAQPTGLISESGGTDRWALLAGIKKD